MCTVSGATMNPWENYKIFKKILITYFCLCTKLSNKALNKNCFGDMYIYIFLISFKFRIHNFSLESLQESFCFMS